MPKEKQLPVPRREVAYFAEEMERELLSHAEQFGGDTALAASMGELFNFMSHHGQKLRAAIESGDRDQIKRQSVHVANYAAFVRQVCEPYHEQQMGGLPVTQLRLYLFIRQYILAHKHSPTYQEMAEFLNHNSRSYVQRQVDRLVELGFLRRVGKKAVRNLQLTRKEVKV